MGGGGMNGGGMNGGAMNGGAMNGGAMNGGGMGGGGMGGEMGDGMSAALAGLGGLSIGGAPGAMAGAISHEQLVAEGLVGRLIGKGGGNIRQIRELTGTAIKISSECEPGTDERKIAVSGAPNQVRMISRDDWAHRAGTPLRSC